MKKIICKKEYDTDVATLIQRTVVGEFGDEAGYEESLYQMPGGLYFLYVNGGAESPYPEENILRISKAKAATWIEEHAEA